MEKSPTEFSLRLGKIIPLALAGVILFCGPRAKSEDEAPEYQVKAAFLYNFAKFVEWPPESFPETSSPIVIGILGADPFGETLDQTVQDKMVRERKLSIERSSQIENLKQCHILFISSDEEARLPRIFTALKGKSILTVGENRRFARNGGMINFLIKSNRVRFEINQEAAEQAGLKISSQLLKVAEKVIEIKAKR